MSKVTKVKEDKEKYTVSFGNAGIMEFDSKEQFQKELNEFIEFQKEQKKKQIESLLTTY